LSKGLKEYVETTYKKLEEIVKKEKDKENNEVIVWWSRVGASPETIKTCDARKEGFPVLA
jgi:fructoselysine-6-P-deglycase FrlB-like protein